MKWTGNDDYWTRESLERRARDRERVKACRKAKRLKLKARRRPAYMAWYDTWYEQFKRSRI